MIKEKYKNISDYKFFPLEDEIKYFTLVKTKVILPDKMVKDGFRLDNL